jgi:hypothetical protein
MNYERHIAAFIDILDFEPQISGTSDKDDSDVPAKIDNLTKEAACVAR